MRGIYITDPGPNGGLAFDLRDILALIGEMALRSTWMVSDVECAGLDEDAARELEAPSQAIDGSRFVALAQRVGQVIDGEFSGYLDSSSPWIIIRAIDSSAFWVMTERTDIIQSLRAHFTATEELNP